MLLAYIDEFGHIGPYISTDHPKYNNHPVFGYAGYIIPAHQVRILGGYFKFVRNHLLAPEIEMSGKNPDQWEKKGASLLTTKNVLKYGHEIRPALGRIFSKMDTLGAKIVYSGQIKPVGPETETNESSSARSSHVLRQIIQAIASYAASLEEDVLIFMDSVETKPRLEALSVSASFIYSNASDSVVKRVLEAPMQLESNLYATTQLADWVCSLLGRASHFHLTRDSEFTWAPKLLSDLVPAANVTSESKIQGHNWGKKIRYKSIINERCYLEWSESHPQSDTNPPSTPSQKPCLTQKIGEMNPDLKKFYATLENPRSTK